MYLEWVWQLLVGAVLVWNLILTVLIWKNRNFLKDLFPESGQRDIRKKFEELLQEVTGFKTKLTDLSKKLTVLEADGLKHTQKVKLMRYNPYEDVGGDQSFSVAFLDKNDTGVVLTSLHTRAGTRVFAKPVNSAKALNYEFSKEEEKVVKEAI